MSARSQRWGTRRRIAGYALIEARGTLIWGAAQHAMKALGRAPQSTEAEACARYADDDLWRSRASAPDFASDRRLISELELRSRVTKAGIWSLRGT